MSGQSLQNWVDVLGDLLADKEHVTWSAESLVNYINTALSALSSARPDSFTSEISLALIPGGRQSLPEGVISVVGQPYTQCIGVSGTLDVGSTASVVDNNTVVAFSKFLTCAILPTAVPKASTPAETALVATSGVTALCSDWSIAGFVFNPQTPTILTVTPPVPDDVRPTLKLSIQGCPPYYTWPADAGKTLLCRHRHILLEYILMYAYDSESESELAMQRAQAHWTRYQALLGFEYRVASRFGSGYFGGRKPDGSADDVVVRG